MLIAWVCLVETAGEKASFRLGVCGTAQLFKHCWCEQVKLGIPGGEAMAAAASEMLIPLKRIGTPDEAAGAMLLLACPYASFISGQTLEVTGGAYI